MSTVRSVRIHSGGDRERLKTLLSNTVDAGTKMTSPQKFTTSKKFKPSSRTLHAVVSSPSRIQSPTVNGFVTNIITSVRNIVLAVVPNTNAHATRTLEMTSHSDAMSTWYMARETNIATE